MFINVKHYYKGKCMEQQLFTLKYAAKILGVSYSWLNIQAKNEKINVTHMGGQRMISINEIERIKKNGIM